MKALIKTILLLFSVLSIEIYFGQSHHKDELRKADSIINHYSQPDAPGMAIGIIRNGKVTYKKTYGLANLEDRISVTDSTAFDIASVSKQFTAFIALMAEQDGKLSLNDDIRTYLPELKHLPYTITIRQLANHTHGLPDFTNIKRLQGFGMESQITNTEAVNTVLAIKSINFISGEQYKYNNTGFILLAEILHRIYKKDFADLIREYIFNPLHMNHTNAVNNPEIIIPNKAESYKENKGHFIKKPLGQMENGSSNIFTTLNDLCRWAVNFQNPTVGSREIYQKMQQNTYLSTGEKIEYGLGLQTGKYKGLDIVFHGGGTAGYRAYILHVPAYHLSIVLMSNKGNFDGLLIAYKLIDVFLEDHEVLPALPKKTTYTSTELKQFEGTYEIDPGNYMEITTDGKKLYAWGSKTPLESIGDHKFSIPFIPTAYITFHTGKLIFSIGDFVFTCKKEILNPPDESKMDLHQFIGYYKNEEFNTIYELIIKDNKLVARHAINPEVILHPLSLKSFYSREPFLGRIHFEYDKNNKMKGFILSGANMFNIQFKKIK